MIDFSAIKAIRTEEEYRAALAAVRPFFSDEPDPESEEGARFEALSLLIERYEDRHFPIAPPTPLEAIHFRMEQGGQSQADLANLLGSRSRASEILSGKRGLTLEQIRILHKAWGIPLLSLVGDAEHA